LYFGAVIELGGREGGRGGVATRGVLVWFDGKNLTKLGILIFKKLLTQNQFKSNRFGLD
jgi:hypothetical protein